MVTLQATPALSEADHIRITQAVKAAEAGTAGEIVVVVETESCEEREATLALVAAGLLAIASAVPLAWLGVGVVHVAIVQALVFAVLAGLAASSRVRETLGLDRLSRAAAAHAEARRAFEELGLGRTQDRTGVLIHVALADRHVEVIADEGVHAAVAPETWAEGVEEIVTAAREGRLADGIVAAVGRCGTVLAEALPPRPGLGDELPDAPVTR
jgi:putative membrane protein